MNNNKGQVLVAFVLLLPVLIMFMGLLVDVGYLYVEKRHVDNNIKDALKYGLKNIELEPTELENKIKKQINLNVEDISGLTINIQNQIIDIKIGKNKNSIFSIIFSKFEYKIETHYRGYINENKIVIRKV